VGVAEHNGLALDRQYACVIKEKDFQREQGARKSKHSTQPTPLKKFNTIAKQKPFISRVKIHMFFCLFSFDRLQTAVRKIDTQKRNH
jgi:hypothetical protein